MINKFELIRDLVRQIPKGKVSTYGAVAEKLGIKSARVVGWALRGNQDVTLACHRVVHKNGTLDPKFSLGGADEQQRRLEIDGIIFKKNHQVDLEKFQFTPQK